MTPDERKLLLLLARSMLSAGLRSAVAKLDIVELVYLISSIEAADARAAEEERQNGRG